MKISIISFAIMCLMCVSSPGFAKSDRTPGQKLDEGIKKTKEKVKEANDTVKEKVDKAHDKVKDKLD